MRWLAIDHGTRRIGLALCDPSETVVTPRAVWPNEPGTTARIAELVRDESVEAVVIGLPRHADGTDSATAEGVRRFAETLRRALPEGMPVRFGDETLTTVEAARRIGPAPGRRRRGRRREGHLDDAAAAVILEDLIAVRRERGIPVGSPGPDDGPSAPGRDRGGAGE